MSEADGDLVGDDSSEMGHVFRETNVSAFEGHTHPGEAGFHCLFVACKSVKLRRAG